MASLMEYLGEEYPILSFDENGERFTCRTGNFDFVAASFVGFGLLWEKRHCYSARDLMLCSPYDYDRGIENAFGWAGSTNG